MVAGDSLRVKHVAQLEEGDVRHIDAELDNLVLRKVHKTNFNIRKMSIAGTAKTDVCCRVCFGTRYTITTGRNGNYINKCPHCHGSGRMFTPLSWHERNTKRIEETCG